ncbi:hypothetical protein BN871_AJ_00060 [Paenibacillus sp. P22]|nr:hypothetical protein BN871_AJ_00060 [Paenibacillus sp. P22]
MAACRRRGCPPLRQGGYPRQQCGHCVDAHDCELRPDGMEPRPGHQPDRLCPRHESCHSGDAEGRLRFYRQHLLDRRNRRHGRIERLHGGQGRPPHADQSSGGRVRQAEHPRQLRPSRHHRHSDDGAFHEGRDAVLPDVHTASLHGQAGGCRLRRAVPRFRRSPLHDRRRAGHRRRLDGALSQNKQQGCSKIALRDQEQPFLRRTVFLFRQHLIGTEYGQIHQLGGDIPFLVRHLLLNPPDDDLENGGFRVFDGNLAPCREQAVVGLGKGHAVRYEVVDDIQHSRSKLGHSIADQHGIVDGITVAYMMEQLHKAWMRLAAEIIEPFAIGLGGRDGIPELLQKLADIFVQQSLLVLVMQIECRSFDRRLIRREWRPAASIPRPAPAPPAAGRRGTETYPCAARFRYTSLLRTATCAPAPGRSPSPDHAMHCGRFGCPR